MSTIRQLLKSSPITVREDDNLALALQVMVWGDVRHLPVMGGDGLVGVLSEHDLLRRYADIGRGAGAREKVSAAMSSPPVTIGPDDGIAEAIKLVSERRIGCLPVVDRGRLLGLVTRSDLLGYEVRAGDERAEEPVPDARQRPAWSALTVDNVMSSDPLTASPEDSVRTAINRMGRHGVRHLAVVDSDCRVVGMLSDRDVRTAIGDPMRAVISAQEEAHIASTPVRQAMTAAPMTLPRGTRLSRAAALFADHKVGAVPIVDDKGRLAGLISYMDVLRAVLGAKSTVS